MSLTPRQKAFVEQYAIDRNGAGAAVRAGYAEGSAKVTASRLLTKDNVRAAVDAATRKVSEATESSSAWVRRKLVEEATNYAEGASHSARIRALELVGKMNGDFEVDNKQKTGVTVVIAGDDVNLL